MESVCTQTDNRNYTEIPIRYEDMRREMITSRNIKRSSASDVGGKDVSVQYVYVPADSQQTYYLGKTHHLPSSHYRGDIAVTYPYPQYRGDVSVSYTNEGDGNYTLPYVVRESQTKSGEVLRVPLHTYSTRSSTLPRLVRNEGESRARSNSWVISSTFPPQDVHSYKYEETITDKKSKRKKEKAKKKSKRLDASIQTNDHLSNALLEKKRSRSEPDLYYRDDISLSSKRLETGSVASRLTHNYYTGELLTAKQEGKRTKHEANHSKYEGNYHMSSRRHTTSPYITYKATRGTSAGYMDQATGMMHHHQNLHAEASRKRGWKEKYLYGWRRAGKSGSRLVYDGRYGVFQYQEVMEGQTSRTIFTCCGCSCGTKCLALQVVIFIVFLLLVVFIIVFTVTFVA